MTCVHFWDVVKGGIDGVPCEIATCRKCGQVDRYDYCDTSGIYGGQKRSMVTRGREPKEEIMETKIQTPWERHREVEAHREEIKADLLRLGQKWTREKWGIGNSAIRSAIRSWFTTEERLLIPGYARSRKGEHAVEAVPVGVEAANAPEVEVPPAEEPPAMLPPLSPSLPHWSEAWTPEVQVEWLRAYRAQTEAVIVTVSGGQYD